MPIRLNPGTSNNSQRNALYFDIDKTNRQHNPIPLTHYAMMNRDLSYNYPGGRVLIGHNAEDTLKRRQTNHNDHIYGYTSGPYKPYRNRWHAQNSFGARRESRIPQKYTEISKEPEKYVTSLNDTVLELDSGTETCSCDQIETEGKYKTSSPTQENSEYPENKFSTVPSTDSSVHLLRKTLSTQKLMVAQLFLQTLQC